jgi:hypothetical protein
MTKRLICVFAVLLLCTPAHAGYQGVLSGSLPITFLFANHAGNVGSAAATICFVVQAGKHADGSNLVCYTLTAQPGVGFSQVTVVPPTGSTRVVAEIDAALGSAIPNQAPGDFDVYQPNVGYVLLFEYTADIRFVWDIQ